MITFVFGAISNTQSRFFCVSKPTYHNFFCPSRSALFHHRPGGRFRTPPRLIYALNIESVSDFSDLYVTAFAVLLRRCLSINYYYTTIAGNSPYWRKSVRARELQENCCFSICFVEVDLRLQFLLNLEWKVFSRRHVHTAKGERQSKIVIRLALLLLLLFSTQLLLCAVN